MKVEDSLKCIVRCFDLASGKLLLEFFCLERWRELGYREGKNLMCSHSLEVMAYVGKGDRLEEPLQTQRRGVLGTIQGEFDLTGQISMKE